MIPKKVWLLWFQGWDNAPPVVQGVRKTWEHHNPNWEIILLDMNNLHKYVTCKLPYTTPQALSDIIRLHLLATHGGIWADATMACMRPLDSWIDHAIAPAGFWMYHGRDKGRGPASWFMASLPNSYIANTWNGKSQEFWKVSHPNLEYFWMDQLFSKLALTDPMFLEQWKKVPYLNCEDPLSAHCMAGKVFDYNPDMLEEIYRNPPFAIKLSHHGPLHAYTNGSHVLAISLQVKQFPLIEWQQPPSFDGANFFSME